MFVFEGPVEGRDALQDYLTDREEALPDDVRERLFEATKERSPVVGCRTLAELVYARRSELPPILCDLAAGVAVMMATHGFNEMDRNSRGPLMAGALRRDAQKLPEGIEPQHEDRDPAPATEFLPEAETSEATP
jgi:hypothetical protein